MDGRLCQVHLGHEIGDQKLTITYLKDSIIIDDFIDYGGEVVILKQRFLAVKYEIRIGSDQSCQRFLLLCVNGNKLCQALHIVSTSTSDFAGDRTDYRVKVYLTGAGKAHYKLTANVHDENKSKQDPKTNHNYNKSTALSFDTSRGLFYNTLKPLSKYFTIYDAKSEKMIKRYIKGSFPTIGLGKYNYYYIHGDWYEDGYEDALIKYSYR